VPEPPGDLRAVAVEQQTDELRLFKFAPAEGGTFEDWVTAPGQVALLSSPGLKPSYLALASPPGAAHLEFLVKRSGELAGLLFDDGVGATVRLDKLLGNGFDVRSQAGKDLVFVAMGTAIGPIRSAILEVGHSRRDFGSVKLVYGVRRPDAFAFVDEMDRWREHGVVLELTVTQPGDNGWSGAVGRVQPLLADVVRDTFDPVAFICGSTEMMQETSHALEALGLPPERILRNY
jgi:NAD(P)H-flavin reductase